MLFWPKVLSLSLYTPIWPIIYSLPNCTQQSNSFHMGLLTTSLIKLGCVSTFCLGRGVCLKSLVKPLDCSTCSTLLRYSPVFITHRISHLLNRHRLTCISDGWIEHCQACHPILKFKALQPVLKRTYSGNTPAVPGVHSTFTQTLSYAVKDQVQHEWIVWIQCPYCRKQNAVHPPLPQWFHSGVNLFELHNFAHREACQPSEAAVITADCCYQKHDLYNRSNPCCG